jgi:hypothetical protein
VPARAELLPDTEICRVEELMAAKYRIDLLVIRPIRAVQAVLHRRHPRGTPVVLALTPLPAAERDRA